jgi:polar amino acid transport system substrate-binding protein
VDACATTLPLVLKKPLAICGTLLVVVAAMFGLTGPKAFAQSTTNPAPSPSPTVSSTPTVSSAPAEPSVGAVRTLNVAIKPLDPFVIKDPKGAYRGFSIDLWSEVAKRNGWQTNWQLNTSVKEVLGSVQSGQADAGIAGITITKDREQTVDFSYPMFASGLSIAAAKKDQSGLWTALKQIFSARLLRMLAILGVGILVVGNLMWVVKYRRRASTRRYHIGVIEGMWFAGKTLGSADFGDEEPTKPIGRLFALVWMFAGIIIIQYFTALTTTALTIQQIDGSIKGPQDLPGKRVVTVDGTTADTWLNEQGIAHSRVKTIDLAYPELTTGHADAIVFDAPVLLRWVATAGGTKARMAGPIFKAENYGIAVASGSPLREEVNASLLEMQADGTYLSLYNRWFQGN